MSRSQLIVYAAVAVAVLLVGARWIRDDSARPASASSGAGFAADAEAPGQADAGDVVVHVAGAVRRPGVYRLPAGARVADAVRRARGVAPGGSEDGINLAARLSDGQQIVVLGRAPAGAAAADGPISLGSATVEQLDEIEGIGPITAQNIVEFRDQHGGLSSIEELDQISGIGPSTMEALRAELQP